MFTLKIFYFHNRFMGGNTCRIEKHLYFVKLIMRMVSYIPYGNILADGALSRRSRNVEFLIVQEAVSLPF